MKTLLTLLALITLSGCANLGCPEGDTYCYEARRAAMLGALEDINRTGRQIQTDATARITPAPAPVYCTSVKGANGTCTTTCR